MDVGNKKSFNNMFIILYYAIYDTIHEAQTVKSPKGLQKDILMTKPHTSLMNNFNV